MVNYTWPASDYRALSEQIDAAASILGKGHGEAVKWAAGHVCASMSAATKVSPKLRRVVRNPHPDAKNDGRRAKWGVMKYKYKTSEQYFVPILRTGEYGKIRYKDKKTAEWYELDPTTKKRVKVQWGAGNGEFLIPGIMQSKKRIIGRRRLAKETWQWARAQILSRQGSAIGDVMGVSSVAEIRITQQREYTSFFFRNNLRYATNALKGGRQTLDGVLLRASDSMRHIINDSIKKMFKERSQY